VRDIWNTHVELHRSLSVHVELRVPTPTTLLRPSDEPDTVTNTTHIANCTVAIHSVASVSLSPRVPDALKKETPLTCRDVSTQCIVSSVRGRYKDGNWILTDWIGTHIIFIFVFEYGVGYR